MKSILISLIIGIANRERAGICHPIVHIFCKVIPFSGARPCHSICAQNKVHIAVVGLNSGGIHAGPIRMKKTETLV